MRRMNSDDIFSLSDLRRAPRCGERAPQSWALTLIAFLIGAGLSGTASARGRLTRIERSGPIEIELIQVLSGETPHSEHLREHGEGLHHVRFRVDALDAKLEELATEGFEVSFYKRFGPSVAFAYLDAPAAIGGSCIELLEMPG